MIGTSTSPIVPGAYPSAPTPTRVAPGRCRNANRRDPAVYPRLPVPILWWVHQDTAAFRTTCHLDSIRGRAPGPPRVVCRVLVRAFLLRRLNAALSRVSTNSITGCSTNSSDPSGVRRTMSEPVHERRKNNNNNNVNPERTQPLPSSERGTRAIDCCLCRPWLA